MLSRLVRSLDRFLARSLGYPLLTIQVVLYVLIAWGVFGSGLGLSDLYWHVDTMTQALTGAATCWLFGTVVFVNTLLVGPRELPGLPSDTSRYLAAHPWIPFRIPTLFPSRNPGVRQTGAEMVLWFFLFFLLVFGGRWVAVGLGSEPPSSSGVPFVIGYFGSLLLGWVIAALANRTNLREWLADREWLRRSFDRPSVQIATTPYHGLHGEPCSLVSATQVPFVDEEFRFSPWSPLPAHIQFAAYNLRTLRLLHALALVFGLINTAGLLFVVALDAFGWILPPAVIASLFLIFLNVSFGFFAFRTRAAWATGLALVVYLIVVNLEFFGAYRMTFDGVAGKHPDGTAADYDRPLKLGENFLKDEYPKREPARKLIGANELLENNAKARKAPDGDKPRLVVVAVSGGGIRAAVWTAVVLEGLERQFPAVPGKPGIRDHLRIFAGASGGMVGAGAYVSDFPFAQPGGPAVDKHGLGPLSSALAEDSLTPVIQTMLVSDFTSGTFFPARRTRDRGRTLEEQWGRNFTARLGRDPLAPPMLALHDDERHARRPALVFTPMMVEDSKRLFVSNLSLTELTSPAAHRIGTPVGDGLQLVSRTGLEFFRLFPDSNAFTVGTAARMSATFPVVSPAVPLPVDPPRRLVDAGYFDNYGVDVLAHWLLSHRDAVIEHTSGILLIQIRGYALEHGGTTISNETPSPVMQIVGAVSAPLQAVFTARSSAAFHRNNELLVALQKAYNDPKLHPRLRTNFFTTATFECDGDAALNWYLTPNEKRDIAGKFFYLDDAGTRGNTKFEGTLNSIDRWMNEPTLKR